MNALLIILALPVLLTLQSRLPTAWWLGGLRIEFVPALVVYAVLTLPHGGAIGFAFAAGFLQDSLSAGPVGLHAAVYATVTAILTGMYDILDRELPVVQIGAGAVMAAASSLAGCIVTGFSGSGLVKVFILALFSAVLTPVTFLALDAVRHVLRRES
jgi:rod shape-determining protein MreD